MKVVCSCHTVPHFTVRILKILSAMQLSKSWLLSLWVMFLAGRKLQEKLLNLSLTLKLKSNLSTRINIKVEFQKEISLKVVGFTLLHSSTTEMLKLHQNPWLFVFLLCLFLMSLNQYHIKYILLLV